MIIRVSYKYVSEWTNVISNDLRANIILVRRASKRLLYGVIIVLEITLVYSIIKTDQVITMFIYQRINRTYIQTATATGKEANYITLVHSLAKRS